MIREDCDILLHCTRKVSVGVCHVAFRSGDNILKGKGKKVIIL